MNAKRILCPFDFSDNSETALGYASKLAAESGATLFLVHVDESHMAYDSGFAGYVPPPNESERLTEMLKERVATVKGVTAEHHLLTGQPADTLVEFAKAHDMDLIVMGTHGRTGVSRMLMGSVAEAVVRRAECPVLTVKTPSEKLSESA